jgi:hypothetical protein
LTNDLVKTVRMMDGVNRLRFRDNPALLAAWENVSRIHATPKSGDSTTAEGSSPAPAPAPASASASAPSEGGEARPAA